jgi:hypothetical protein
MIKIIILFLLLFINGIKIKKEINKNIKIGCILFEHKYFSIECENCKMFVSYERREYDINKILKFKSYPKLCSFSKYSYNATIYIAESVFEDGDLGISTLAFIAAVIFICSIGIFYCFLLYICERLEKYTELNNIYLKD